MGFVRFLFLAGLAFVANGVALSGAALAQVPGDQGFFGNIDGRWMWLGGNPYATSQTGPTQTTGSGPGGQMMIGFKFDPHWDAALVGDVQGLLTQLTKLQNGTMSVDTNHQHFDLELGYSNDWWRLNAGLRGIHYIEAIAYNVPGFAGNDMREMYGIGPKIGAGALWPISQTWGIVAAGDLALLYTSVNDSGSGVLAGRGSYWQWTPQFDAELGLSWNSTDNPAFSFSTGGRIATSFNTAITSDPGTEGTRLEFGPFVRISYNFSGPHRHRAQALTAEAPSPPATRDFRLFFGFDSAEIGLVAAATLRQAADDVRHGRTARISFAGPGETQADADYNRALAQRRAEAVRDELIRNGLAPGQVSIASRYEPEVPVPVIGAVSASAQVSF
ncbi:MAG: OmpA family protein [Alphaproteobacteria bacterium]|nr:OmpA family protein [Alphaproteobacteria bacterium]